MKTRLFKILSVMALTFLLLGMSIRNTHLHASDEDETLILEMENYYTLSITPTGYTISGSAENTYSGDYILVGEMNTDLEFKNTTNEVVEYNVILHEFKANSKQWNGCLTVESGVTLNLVVYGENTLFGHNHAGIKVVETGNDLETTVNITIMDNSKLSVGSTYEDTYNSFSGDLTVNLLKGSSSVEMEGDWMTNNKVVDFSNGEIQNHSYEYTKVDDFYCHATCDTCDLISLDLDHNYTTVSLDSEHENYQTHHQMICGNCKSFTINDTISEHDLYFEELDETDENYKTHHYAKCNGCDVSFIQSHNLDALLFDNEKHATSCLDCSYVDFDTYSQHTFDENYTCTECNSSVVFAHTILEETVYYFSFADAIASASSLGGKLTLLCDVDAQNGKITGNNAEYTLDLNGYTISNVTIFIDSRFVNSIITVMDSSDSKTGQILNQPGLGSILYGGKVIFDGINTNHSITAARQGILEYNDVTLTNDYYIESDYGGILILNNVKSDYKVYLRGYGEEFNEEAIQIKGGSFSGIYIYDSVYISGYNLLDFLESGYAFYQNGKVVDANVTSLENVTVEIHEHTYNVYKDTGFSHQMGCECGLLDEGSSEEYHTLGEDGNCEVCGSKIKFIVSDGTNNYYGLSLLLVFDRISDIDNAVITLIDNVELSKSISISKNLVIDLNGYSLISKDIYVYEESTLIINDSSETQTGQIKYNADNYIYFNLFNVFGTLIINGGTINSSIYVEGGQEQPAKVEINGGTFNAYTILEVNSSFDITINGGIFKKSILMYGHYISENYSVIIYGGIFEKGINNNIYGDLISLNSMLPVVDGCDINFANQNNEVITFEDDITSYDNPLTISHSAGILDITDTHHSASCSVCDITYFEDEHNSFYHECDTVDLNVHNTLCGICDFKVSSEAHVGGSANCTQKAVCSKCKVGYGEIESDVHVGGVATCVDLALCTLCGNEYGNLDSQNHSSKETKYVQNSENDLSHDLVHSCCNSVISTGKHHHGDISCTEKAVCVECKLSYGEEPQGHTYSNDCDANCDVCGAGREVEQHKFDNACDADCNTCGAQRNVEHVYDVDGKCVVCGDEKTKVEEKGCKGSIYSCLTAITALTLAIFIARKKKRLE